MHEVQHNDFHLNTFFIYSSFKAAYLEIKHFTKKMQFLIKFQNLEPPTKKVKSFNIWPSLLCTEATYMMIFQNRLCALNQEKLGYPENGLIISFEIITLVKNRVMHMFSISLSCTLPLYYKEAANCANAKNMIFDQMYLY